MSYIVELWILCVVAICLLENHCDDNIDDLKFLNLDLQAPSSMAAALALCLWSFPVRWRPWWVLVRQYILPFHGFYVWCWVPCWNHFGVAGFHGECPFRNLVMSVGCLCIISIPCHNGVNTLLDTSKIHSEYTHAVCVFCLWISVCFCETAVHSANLPMHLWRIIHVKTYMYTCILCVYLVKYTWARIFVQRSPTLTYKRWMLQSACVGQVWDKSPRLAK